MADADIIELHSWSSTQGDQLMSFYAIYGTSTVSVVDSQWLCFMVQSVRWIALMTACRIMRGLCAKIQQPR